MHATTRLARRLRGRAGLLWLYLRDRPAYKAIARVREGGLTYLEPAALVDLHDLVKKTEKAHVEGVLVEAGAGLGGSALVIAASKTCSRPLFVYDVFGMIPAPSERDGAEADARYSTIASGQSPGIRGGAYYGYEPDLLKRVHRTFETLGYPPAEHSIHLIKGDFRDTLLLAEPVALAHIDCDWYNSVRVCLERIAPLLTRGGTLIVDDYFVWPGCRLAVDEYFQARRSDYEFQVHSRLHIRRR